MSPDGTDSGGGLYARLPSSVQLGLALITTVYAVGVLTDTITPLPNDVMTLIWIAVTIALFVHLVQLIRQT